MEKAIYKSLTEILKEELVTAMGCTEPIAVAYCACVCRGVLGTVPESVTVKVSANILKNVKSVVVPNTGNQRGIKTAVAAGIIANRPEAELQVLTSLTEKQTDEIRDFVNTVPIKVLRSDSDLIFDIETQMTANGHTALARISGYHTNIVELKSDGKVLLHKEYTEEKKSKTDHSHLTVENIIAYADTVKLKEVKAVLEHQIECNMAIAEEGLHSNYGANIGSILLKAYGNGVYNRAKAYSAAASDARMNGSALPVVINSGSGNQGITASVPVIIYADELNVTREELLRALIVSNLITVHLKTGIGKLSAYCGATSAGCGAAAGITYLYGGKYYEISHTIVNALAIDSGMICDGAKASCAAKIASAVEAGLLGMQMQKNESQFYAGDGVIAKGVENTINNISCIARDGMKDTDKTIIELMIGAD